MTTDVDKMYSDVADHLRDSIRWQNDQPNAAAARAAAIKGLTEIVAHRTAALATENEALKIENEALRAMKVQLSSTLNATARNRDMWRQRAEEQNPDVPDWELQIRSDSQAWAEIQRLRTELTNIKESPYYGVEKSLAELNDHPDGCF